MMNHLRTVRDTKEVSNSVDQDPRALDIGTYIARMRHR